MRFKRPLFSILLIPVFMGSVLLSARADETYRIVVKDAVGDVEQVADDFEMKLSITASAAGQEQTFDINNREQKRFREEVLGVDAAGHSNCVRRSYSVYRKSEKSNEEEKTSNASLSGKTVRLERKGDKLVITSENGVVSDEDKEALQNNMDSHYSMLFPDRALAVGEEWTPDSKALLKTFKGAEKLTVHCKLVEVVSVSGHKAAHFHMSIDVSMSAKGSGLVMEMNLEGDGYQALDIQRPLSLAFEGPVTASGQETKDGIVTNYTGKGTAHMKMTADWQKVAGKPASKPSSPPAS